MYIDKGQYITAKEINDVLVYSNIIVTQCVLDKLLKIPKLEFSNLDSKTTRSTKFLENIGTVRGKAIPGVYIWTHLSTGSMYVGSSSRLARRLIGYFNNTHKLTGKLIPLIKKEGINNFKLEVILLNDNYSKNHELVLEQYFLLHSKFNLNTLKVVSDITGVRSKNLYMYTKEKNELIYWSDTQEDFIFKLGIHHSIFSNSLKTGKVYLDKYIFKDKLIEGVKFNEKSELEIKNMLDEERLNILNSKKRKVNIKSIDDNVKTITFDGINDCLEYLNKIAPSNKTTLSRRIKLKKPYHGFLCEWGSEKTESFLSKAVTVSITDTYTGKTNMYSSWRKAALSFAPSYITTGQTLKTFAENGKLLLGQYKISVENKE